MVTLKKYLAPNGHIPRGAISRLAEFLKCTHYRAVQLAWGAPAKDDREKRLCGYFVAQQAEISAKKSGPRTAKKNAVSKKISMRFS